MLYGAPLRPQAVVSRVTRSSITFKHLVYPAYRGFNYTLAASDSPMGLDAGLGPPGLVSGRMTGHVPAGLGAYMVWKGRKGADFHSHACILHKHKKGGIAAAFASSTPHPNQTHASFPTVLTGHHIATHAQVRGPRGPWA